MKTAVVQVWIPEALKKDFEAAVSARGWNLSQAIRQLMIQYVTQEKELTRGRQDTIEVLEDIEAGRVMDGKEVLNWLTGWGTDDEQGPPL